MRQYLKWIAPLIGYVFSTASLQAATTELESRGGKVPDLIMFGAVKDYREALHELTRLGLESSYLRVLFTADLLFPLSYGILFYLLGVRSGRWRYAAILATTSDVLENLSAFVCLNGYPAEGLFWVFNCGKWSSLAVAVLAAVYSMGSYVMERARVLHQNF